MGMTKQEALTAMEEGKKVTHSYFGQYEYMYLENNKYKFEDGIIVLPERFWKLRQGEGWEKGWRLWDGN